MEIARVRKQKSTYEINAMLFISEQKIHRGSKAIYKSTIFYLKKKKSAVGFMEETAV